MRVGSSRVYRICYRCASGYEAGLCKPNNIHEEEILPEIIGAIESWLSPKTLEGLMSRAEEIIRNACAKQNVDKRRAEKARLEKQIARAQRNLSLLDCDEDVLAVNGEIKAWRKQVSEIDAELGEADNPSALRLLREAIKELQACAWELREASKAEDPKRLRAMLRRLIDRIEVQIEATPIAKNRHSYRVAYGEIHLNPGSPLTSQVSGGLISLFNSSPRIEQAIRWNCRFSQGETG